MGIVIGFAIGIAAVVLFVIYGSNELIDSATLDNRDQPTRQAPAGPSGPGSGDRQGGDRGR